MPGTNNFQSQSESRGSPVFAHYANVTPHDSTELGNYARALFIGSAGNVVVTSPAGDVARFGPLGNGTTLNVEAKLVLSTGTTAANITAMW